MIRCVLGVDTSNYTTSLSAVEANQGELLADSRALLPVKYGERGLRQSDALFFHITRLPVLMDNLMAQLHARAPSEAIKWVAAGVSVRPRPACQSYMPVFHAGLSFAASFTKALGIPLCKTSHQENHLAAALHFVDLPRPAAPFLAIHLSGGTSDVLLATATRFGYRIEMLGEGSDLHAGQFVDRVGVALGGPFPSGPYLESLAEQVQDTPFRIPSRVLGASLSFSGPCSAALRAIESGIEPAIIASAVQACIATSLIKAITHAVTMAPTVEDIVIAGGVAANQWIRNRVVHRLSLHVPQLRVHFATPTFSSDHALGTAKIAWKHARYNMATL